jgi:hypothetical protein
MLIYPAFMDVVVVWWKQRPDLQVASYIMFLRAGPLLLAFLAEFPPQGVSQYQKFTRATSETTQQ